MDANDLSSKELQTYRKLDFGTQSPTNSVEGKELSIILKSSSQLTKNIAQDDLSNEFIPSIGMEFNGEDEAYKFYQQYAKNKGFGIRKGNTHKDSSTGVLLDRIFCCCRQGKRQIDKRDSTVKKHRAETRCGCNAMMKICCREVGKYKVVQFVADHNHELSTPSKSHLFRCHRNMTKCQQAEIDIATSRGINPKDTLEFMARHVGGRENLGFIRDDCKNYLKSKRTMQMRIGDTGGVLEYLQRMQLEDPNYFYAIQLDADDLITNILWFDTKMKMDYSKFGDVVCFDTTYRNNKDGRPIALFVGVNHHKQSIIFGAGLLYDETTETFEWLFDTFSKAMGRTPKTILTDQCKAMAKAIASKWPETYHRLCIWHIYQNAATNLSSVFSKNKEFSKDFSNCVYDYEMEKDFIDAWNEMLSKYNLQDNEWLQKMFEMKEKWALVYGRDTFCADMSTTQRSESINNLLKKYVSYKHDLLIFFEHFQRLLDDRRYQESVADFNASQTVPCLPFTMQIMKHACIHLMCLKT